MPKGDKSSIIEQGDIFFFYRPKVGAEEVSSVEDVQRFYMITSPEEKDSKYRLFVLGQKQLQRSLRENQHQRKETGHSTLLPQIILKTYARSFSQLNMKPRQGAREELQQLRRQAKANTLL